MEKKLIAVLLLFLVVGAAFGQTSADSTQAQKSSKLLPRLKFKKEPHRLSFKRNTPLKDENRLHRQAPNATTKKEEVTPFYSNMPMAKLQGRKRDRMPSAKADSSKHYHLLKKRFKVLPVPTEPEENVNESEEKSAESRK